MLETVLALFFLCLVFFLVVDYAETLKTRTILDYAAARGARARAVGFNDFMVTKTVRIATMAAAGKCRTAEDEGHAPTAAFLNSRAGSYLQSEDESYAHGILDFELWENDKLDWHVLETGGPQQGDVTLKTHQRHPLFSYAPNGATEADVSGEAKIESHYRYYLK